MSRKERPKWGVLARAAMFIGMTVIGAACIPTAPDLISSKHDLEFHPRTMLIDIPSRHSDASLTPAERHLLDRFLVGFLSRHSGPLTILPGRGSTDKRFAQRIRNHAVQRGVPASWLLVHNSDDPATTGTILLRYQAFAIGVPDCGNWEAEAHRNFHNTPHPNHGCALKRNLALIAADPADLIRQRAIDTSDSQRLNLVIQQYRSGELGSGSSSGDSENSGESSE